MERDFFTVLDQALARLYSHGRVTYNALKLQFHLDDTQLAVLKEELLYTHPEVVDDAGRGLIWTGRLSHVAVTDSRHAEPTDAAGETPRAPSHGEQVLPAEPAPPTRPVPEAERRQLTVLFCDLVGSTQLSGQLDPEDLRAVVRGYQEAAAEVIQSYAGHIAQYLGDGLLVYFGYPAAHEDDARRAVHAGLRIVQAIATLNTRLGAQYGVQLAVRLGIHTGPVVVGVMGGGGRTEHLALGETPNIAARLQNLALANAVVISPVTARLVRGTFALEDLGTHALPGVAEAMAVSRVRGLLATPSHDEEFLTVAVPVLVGREEESGLLRRRWEQSKAGLGQVVCLSGEAGIGKSALVEALRAQVRTEGLPRIAFRCSPYHTTSALYPVITQLERLLQFEPDDPPSTRLAKLEAGLRPSGLSLAEVVPLFAGLLSVPVPAERYAPLTLTPQQQKQQTLDALLAWLAAEAERRPVLVAWEDLHWADPTTLEVLGLVSEQAPTMPMLHVLTFRPEFSPPWPPRSHITPLVLNRLERPQVEALIGQRVGGKTLPAEVVEHIVAKTDGVPLYVEELTKMLLGSALLREMENHYVLTGPLHTVAIPDTLQAALMARLDQLQTAKEVAQLGAALGREFAYELLAAIAPQDEDTLQAGLAQLVAAELLYQRGRPPRARYLFKHALIQDAAYASLLKSTRQQVHQQVAQVLETRFPALAETQPELVAQHYTAAGCAEQAIVYWQRAGQQASERSAYLEAISHLTTAIELLTSLPETPEHTQQALTLYIVLGAALQVTKGHTAPEVEHAYTRARELCRQVGDTPQLVPVLFGLWRFYLVRPQLYTARELGETLLRLAQQAHDPALAVIAHYALGVTWYFLGALPAARQHLEEGIAHYTPDQRHAPAFRIGQDPGVGCRAFAALTFWLLGYPAQALARLHEALALAPELSHPFSLAFAQSMAAWVSQLRRDVPAVRAHAETAVTLATAQGFPLWAALGTSLRGWALAMQGQGEEGMAQVRQGLAAWRATGAALYVPYLCTVLADVCDNLGHPADGLQALAEAHTLVEQHEERWWEAEICRLRGVLLLRQPETPPAEAEAWLQRALDVARSQEAKSLELRAAMSVARLWQQQGKRAEARELLAPVYSWFTKGFDTADLQEAKAFLDELA
ncbi:MAG TPA: adenylate/guanylate cyclase domain-containing protein [Candidatus Tectomicrobia bacterium]|nr:adenylate/guanylate cyclase domain-containing protein [Candidatus Tectomicrobia bacterium]